MEVSTSQRQQVNRRKNIGQFLTIVCMEERYWFGVWVGKRIWKYVVKVYKKR